MCRLGRPDSGSPQPLAFRAFEPWPAGRGPDRTAGRPSQRPSQGGCLRGIRLWQPAPTTTAATLKGGRVLAIVAGVGYGNSSLLPEAPVFREASKQREVLLVSLLRRRMNTVLQTHAVVRTRWFTFGTTTIHLTDLLDKAKIRGGEHRTMAADDKPKFCLHGFCQSRASYNWTWGMPYLHLGYELTHTVGPTIPPVAH